MEKKGKGRAREQGREGKRERVLEGRGGKRGRKVMERWLGTRNLEKQIRVVERGPAKKYEAKGKMGTTE